jgi:hypothetical protein
LLLISYMSKNIRQKFRTLLGKVSITKTFCLWNFP